MHPAGVASVAARRTLLDSAWGRKRAMATGSSTQITKQRGEYLVAAELGKFGYFAATFSGSVPDFDIVAVDQDGRSVVCQVKAIAGPSWQFDARKFLEIEHDGPAQRVVAAQTLRFPDMPWVMVKLDDEGPPIYYVLRHPMFRPSFDRGTPPCLRSMVVYGRRTRCPHTRPSGRRTSRLFARSGRSSRQVSGQSPPSPQHPLCYHRAGRHRRPVRSSHN